MKQATSQLLRLHWHSALTQNTLCTSFTQLCLYNATGPFRIVTIEIQIAASLSPSINSADVDTYVFLSLIDRESAHKPLYILERNGSL